jgi:acetyl esterase/lipase
MPSWSLAIEGAKKELAQLSGSQKRWRALQIGLFAIREALSSTKLIPFALRSLRARNHVKKAPKTGQGRERLIADLKYDERPRSNLDVYPPESPTDGNQSGLQLAPVVVFVHGGVWSSGELWHYSTLGKHLASQGVCCVVATYNFYPDVLCAEQISDVNKCITWVADNISKHGGDAERITLVGHSSGAHLSMMAVLARAGIYSSSSTSSSSRQNGSRSRDKRMPAKVVLMAGVYDIEKHFQYEKGRGVHTLSAMTRAMGGATNFGKFSPAVLLLNGNGNVNGKQEKEATKGQGKVLDGEMLGSLLGSGFPGAIVKEGKSTDFGHTIPPLYLMSGLADNVVPWIWSKEFSEILHARGLKARSLIYHEATHMDFIACWDHGNPSSIHQSISGDMLKIVKD